MGKVVDITEKLGFEENPKLKVKDVELEVNADAKTVLQIMGIIGNGKDVTPDQTCKTYLGFVAGTNNGNIVSCVNASSGGTLGAQGTGSGTVQ